MRIDKDRAPSLLLAPTTIPSTYLLPTTLSTTNHQPTPSFLATDLPHLFTIPTTPNAQHTTSKRKLPDAWCFYSYICNKHRTVHASALTIPATCKASNTLNVAHLNPATLD